MSMSPQSAPPAISVRSITRHFRRVSGSTAVAVDDLSLDVRKGEMVAVVGPSGCGKTTLLRCIAGLEMPTSGDIRLGGRVVFDSTKGISIPPEGRGVGMMFQSYALWPHLTVAENVAYPLRCHGLSKKEAAAPVAAMLEKLGLRGLEGEPPSRLSGGQQQRVALARSLVSEPTVVLFDEPLSNVDAKVREELRLELVRMHKDLGFSGLYVTHDQDDALQVCDRIIVLRNGRIEQEGTPSEVYDTPASVYVAEFVGVANRLAGSIAEQGGADLVVQTALGRIASRADGTARPGGREVAVLVRPHHLRIAAGTSPEGPNSWQGTVAARMFKGAWMQYLVRVGESRLTVWSSDHSIPDGAVVVVSVAPADVIVRDTA